MPQLFATQNIDFPHVSGYPYGAFSVPTRGVASQLSGDVPATVGDNEIKKTTTSISPMSFIHSLSTRAKTLMVTASVVAGTSHEAFASAGHGEPSISDLTFYWINFLLYVGIMTYILRKPLAKGWAARAARIKQSVMQSSDDVEAAERELNAIEALTKTLPQEEERVRNQIIEQANAEAADIVRQAEQRAVRIREQAKELLKGETRSAQASFRQALVARAVQIAKEKFGAGEFAAREEAYNAAAVTRAKQLVQH
jgi:F0F1-type ATP synthase membrane subunit b/b'